jgi:hypothetical protein
MRIEHEADQVFFPYHRDGDATVLTLMINDDYKGGNIIYLTGDGSATPFGFLLRSRKVILIESLANEKSLDRQVWFATWVRHVLRNPANSKKS